MICCSDSTSEVTIPGQDRQRKDEVAAHTLEIFVDRMSGSIFETSIQSCKTTFDSKASNPNPLDVAVISSSQSERRPLCKVEVYQTDRVGSRRC